MSSRIVGGILGYLIPFILFFVFLFALEWLIELILGLIGMMVGGNTTPDFPGPTNLIQSAIYIFPDVWDLGTAIYFGGLGELLFFFYVVIAILDGMVVVGSLKGLKDALGDASAYALSFAQGKFDYLSSKKSSGGSSSSGGTPPGYSDDPEDPFH